MKIEISNATVAPMTAWLKEAEKTGVRDEEKLRQIAVYYQFGLKRNEIRDLMRDPNYDSTRVLKALLAQKQAEGAHLERQLAALEYLIEIGMENALPESVPADFAEALGRRQAELKREQASEAKIATRKVLAGVK